MSHELPVNSPGVIVSTAKGAAEQAGASQAASDPVEVLRQHVLGFINTRPMSETHRQMATSKANEMIFWLRA